eukprot:scaffold9241_cov135-Skeletonema_marinoi.AAC.9
MVGGRMDNSAFGRSGKETSGATTCASQRVQRDLYKFMMSFAAVCTALADYRVYIEVIVSVYLL